MLRHCFQKFPRMFLHLTLQDLADFFVGDRRLQIIRKTGVLRGYTHNRMQDEILSLLIFPRIHSVVRKYF